MITNQHLADCGVCAVANVLGGTWNETAEAIFGPAYKARKRFHTTTRQLSRVLFADPSKLHRALDWSDVPDESVVKVKEWGYEHKGNWHWVAWINSRIWCSSERGKFLPTFYSSRWKLYSYIDRLE